MEYRFAQKLPCFVCDTLVFPWALMREHNEMVCRNCIYYEGNYRLGFTINNTREMKRRASAQLVMRLPTRPPPPRYDPVRPNTARVSPITITLNNGLSGEPSISQVPTSTVTNPRRTNGSPPVLTPEAPFARAVSRERPVLIECTPDIPGMPELNPIPNWFPHPSTAPTATVTSVPTDTQANTIENSIANLITSSREANTESQTTLSRVLRIRPLPNRTFKTSANSNSD